MMIIQGIIELGYNIRSAWFLDIRISTCSELEFKWSVHVINVLNHYMLPILDFLTVYNDIFLSWL